MSSVMTTPQPAKPTTKSLVERARLWLSPLNLHFAGLGLLVLVNLYLLVHMAFLWQAARSNNADAVTQQKIALKTAEIAAQPLRGLDAKLELATAEADRFYRQRLPGTDSEWAAELGVLTKKQGVRYVRGAYTHKPVLAGSAGELTQVQIDSSLSGDYRPLVQFINSLERDKMFFVIDSVTLTGQQSGTVNLRLRLRTYLNGKVPQDDTEAADDATTDSTAKPTNTAGGPSR
jgi:type IV pilus assembly protein PilO